MSIAVIKTGGKQYLVKPGDKLKVEKIADASGKEGATVAVDVLMIGDEKTGKAQVGTPTLDKKIDLKLVGEGRGKKIKIVKYKNKTRYHRVAGHRQAYAEVEVGKF